MRETSSPTQVGEERAQLCLVMLAHSRSKNGVASLAYVAGIHVLEPIRTKDVDGRNKSGHDGTGGVTRGRSSYMTVPWFLPVLPPASI